MFDSATIDQDFERRLRIAMALTNKFWPIHFTPMLERYGSLSAALEADPKELSAIKGLRGKVKIWREMIDNSAVDEELKACADTATTILMPEFDAVPPLLREIPDPPLILWARGEFHDVDRRSLAIVGSRSASHYGLRHSRLFAEGLARAGLTIVSGLARGIDTCAHRGALEAGGRTIAVLGSGLEALYPKENLGLAEKITKAGVVLSEFPLFAKAHPTNFPRRNRIVSGLSLAVLVAQAGKRSGSLITSRMAQEQGREVFALPARIEDDGNEGSHELIRKSGAGLVTSVEDILNDLSLELRPASAEAANLKVVETQNPTEAKICALLKHSDPVNIEEIIATAEISAPEANSALLMLEMRGVITQVPGKSYLLA